MAAAVRPLPVHPWYALVDDPADVVVLDSSDRDIRRWPPSPGSTVVAAGVLDRVRADSRITAEQQARVDALFELVQPGGEVWLSVGNRLSFLHFVGVRPADGRPFEPLLPRSVVTLVRKWAPFMAWSEMRSAVLTRRGYRRLLRAAGFHDIRFLLAFFDASEPDFVVSRNRRDSLERYVRSVRYSRSPRSRLAMGVLIGLGRTRLIDQLAPAFVITARRP